MNICILSMQRVNNYGSLLQSYSLKKTIESLGHKVYFIDIKKEENMQDKRKVCCRGLIKKNSTMIVQSK